MPEQYLAHQDANLLLVFDQKDGLGSLEDCGLAVSQRVDRERVIVPGEIDLERRPLIGAAVHRDVSTALFHDPEHGPQSEARALALFLGREEWLEDATQRRP